MITHCPPMSGSMSDAQRGDFNHALEGIRANSLETVYLKWKCLGPKEAKELAEVLQGNSSVTEIYLVGNHIGDEGASALSAALPASAVRTLSLGDSAIGDQGVAALAAALNASSVQKLNLCNNPIGPAGLQALVAALRQSKLTELDLGSCRIGDREVAALAAVLIDCPLTKLWLCSNSIGDEGAKALAAVLADSKVVSVNLLWNSIGEEGGRALLAGVADSAVTELILRNNLCSDQLCNQICGELEKNQARIFILQLDMKGAEAERQLTFRTLAGTVAATFPWSSERHVKELPEAVFTTMASSGFQVPFKHLRASNLRIVGPAGQLLDVGEETSLAQQLG